MDLGFWELCGSLIPNLGPSASLQGKALLGCQSQDPSDGDGEKAQDGPGSPRLGQAGVGARD